MLLQNQIQLIICTVFLGPNFGCRNSEIAYIMSYTNRTGLGAHEIAKINFAS